MRGRLPVARVAFPEANAELGGRGDELAASRFELTRNCMETAKQFKRQLFLLRRTLCQFANHR